ncbi:MAG: acyl-CoA dehydrogenase [Syntrophobacterales bacterium]|nr:acyl-CoA dehydrogenase [Syntrophobacterales bacterium]
MDQRYLAWPFFDTFHRRFARDFGQWAESELQHFEADEGADGKAAREIFLRLGTGKWLDNSIPGSPGAGGDKHDLRTLCLMREILGYRSAIADVAFSEPWLAIMPIALFASEQVKRELIPAYLRGEMLPAFALSEPGAGSDVASIEAQALLDGDHYVIHGRKMWTSNSGLADNYVVFARTGEGPDAHGISAFLVDARLPGITLEQRLAVLSPHTVGTLHFDHVHVPADRLIGAPGQGFKIAMAVLELFRPTVGAATLGMARRAMDEAIARSLKRVAFKKPLCEHQLIQEKLADMAVKVDASALLVYRAAWMHDVGEPHLSREAAIAKLYATEASQEVIDQALQIFGGLGVLKGMAVERLYRHVRAFRIFDGTSEIQKLIIAKDMLRDQNLNIRTIERL